MSEIGRERERESEKDSDREGERERGRERQEDTSPTAGREHYYDCHTWCRSLYIGTVVRAQFADPHSKPDHAAVM